MSWLLLFVPTVFSCCPSVDIRLDWGPIALRWIMITFFICTSPKIHYPDHNHQSPLPESLASVN